MNARGAVALVWAAFGSLVLALVLRNADINPILDEQQWIQAGLATAHHRFLETGLASGPLPGLLLGAIYSAVYAAGRLAGSFEGTAEFAAWAVARPALFYVLARLLVAGIMSGGLALLARALAPRVGGLWASILVLGFACAGPAIERIGYATPHAAMMGYAAGVLYALLRAAEGRVWGYAVAGLLTAAATATMTHGLGLGLAAFGGAWVQRSDKGAPSRARRLAGVAAGFLAGVLVFGYPALLHPGEYWRSNLLYQFKRQIGSDDGGHGNIFVVWLVQGLPLWAAAAAGAFRGRFDGREPLARIGFATAAAYLLVLGLLTRSAQPSYSLAALPLLAYAASGLQIAQAARPMRVRAAVLAVVLSIPLLWGGLAAAGRLFVENPRAAAARAFEARVPHGATALVDSWWGPALAHGRLRLSPYGAQGERWTRDPAFMNAFERALPPEHRRWTIVDYPRDLPRPDAAELRRRNIGFVAISRLMMERRETAGAWKPLLDDGTLLPDGSLGAEDILLFRVRESR